MADGRRGGNATRPGIAPAGAEQTELFPERVTIVRLDPRAIAGDRTSALAVYRVTIGFGGEHHRVFHDRYGLYCDVHGRTCAAVEAVLRGGAERQSGRGLRGGGMR